jgi:hypothetical protein
VSQTASVWLVIVLALVAANLPFLSRAPCSASWPLRARQAAGRCAWANWWLFYLLVGGLGLLLENRAGQIAPQGWEFYAVTGALFLTLAFPGLRLALPLQAPP